MSASRAVLWDMDGTLIDSEKFHWIAWRNTLAIEGITITSEQFLSSFGQRDDSIIPRWLGTAATPERIERIADAKEELYRHLIRRDGISPLPGVAYWVAPVAPTGWLQAVASAAPRANIDAVLEALSATHVFQGIVSAEDVHRGKPDPEVYLAAAARVGVSPDRCVVAEEAVAGVQGARSAGMRSIGSVTMASDCPLTLSCGPSISSTWTHSRDYFKAIVASPRTSPKDMSSRTTALLPERNGGEAAGWVL